MKYLRAAVIIAAVILDAVAIIVGIVLSVFVHWAWALLPFAFAGLLVWAAWRFRVRVERLARAPRPPAIKPERDPIDKHFGEAMAAWQQPWPVNLAGRPAGLTPEQRELAAEDARAKRYFDGLGDPQ